MSIQFHTTHDVAVVPGLVRGSAAAARLRLSPSLLAAPASEETANAEPMRLGARWVLKAPGHLFALEGLLERYPDARIVHTHRDPLRVMASMASHATVLRRAFSDDADPHNDRRRLGRSLGARARQISRRARSRSGVAVPRRRLRVDRERPARHRRARLRFSRLAADERQRARRCSNFLAANPKNKHGVHSYTLEQFGLSRATETARFRNYCERFRIPVRTER